MELNLTMKAYVSQPCGWENQRTGELAQLLTGDLAMPLTGMPMIPNGQHSGAGSGGVDAGELA